MEGNLGSIGTKICQGDHSFLMEPLNPMDGLTTYDLKMSLPERFDNTVVYAVVADCNNRTNVEYHLTFENPGNFLSRHFSCQDRGEMNERLNNILNGNSIILGILQLYFFSSLSIVIFALLCGIQNFRALARTRRVTTCKLVLQ
eukprot:Gregarina_sp_Poly_1__10186@NODE_700_length_6689_cov_270_629719_g528_i0_p3_GENE_NODE_700_length_6689_cov_270_629719_g528_i0NODE_700_length_6689_cov_270_629719_g528_i0_p3_ORF_typecomplete_len144_score14_54GpcrRhopsn4/PF10192_9/4_1e05Hanta_G2/PF01561_16/0_13zinc_ribbon_6/PF14599_6/0_25_NODE_700_length_6689_cov_270_629719_g528_i057106141